MPWERKNKDTKADEQVNRLLKEDRSDVNMAHGTWHITDWNDAARVL